MQLIPKILLAAAGSTSIAINCMELCSAGNFIPSQYAEYYGPKTQEKIGQSHTPFPTKLSTCLTTTNFKEKLPGEDAIQNPQSEAKIQQYRKRIEEYLDLWQKEAKTVKSESAATTTAAVRWAILCHARSKIWEIIRQNKG